MKTYKNKNGKTQLRETNGRFRKTTLIDFGVPETAINKSKKMICELCGKTCMPILLTIDYKTCNCGGKMNWINKEQNKK